MLLEKNRSKCFFTLKDIRVTVNYVRGKKISEIDLKFCLFLDK